MQWVSHAAKARRQQLDAAMRAVEHVLPSVEQLVKRADQLVTDCGALTTLISETWGRAEGARDARLRFAAAIEQWAADLVELPQALAVPAGLRSPTARTITRTAAAEWATLAATTRSKELGQQETSAKTELATINSERELVQTEYDRLRDGGLVEPRAPHTRLADRTARPGAPLYLLVDFVDQAPGAGHDRALLEAALIACGLADARVFPDGTLGAGPDGHPLLDVQVTTNRHAATTPLSQALRPDPALDQTTSVVPPEIVAALLEEVELVTSAANATAAPGLTVAWDGTWSAGPLRGAYRKQQVKLIGSASREAQRRQLLAALTPADLGTFGRVGVAPVRRAAMTSPLLRLPDETVSFGFFLVRFPTTDDAAAAQTMVRGNRAVYERVRAAGGTLYPVSAFPMSGVDWRAHFGAAWPGVSLGEAALRPP